MTVPLTRAGRRALAAALLLAAAGTLAAIARETLTVVAREAKIRSRKTLLGNTIPGGEVREGDRVTLNLREDPWVNVTFGAVTGWLHNSAVTDQRRVVLSGEASTAKFTAAEASAAKKGFNEEAELAYRASNPDLTRAYAEVERIQARTVSEEELIRFAAEGRLGEGGR